MPHEPPTPPAQLPGDIVDALADLTPEQLEDVARYADELAEHRAREARLERESGDDPTPDEPGDRPDGVPAGASVTVKEINDNRYRYWQWRDGDKIESKYIGPADPD